MAVTHKIRTKDGGIEVVKLSPIKAIRRFCVECVCWEYPEVKGCTATLCPLFPFRTGDAHQVSYERRSRQAELAKKSTIGTQVVPEVGGKGERD